jgi:hypothetical protein
MVLDLEPLVWLAFRKISHLGLPLASITSEIFRLAISQARSPTSVRPNVKGPEQWAYGRVNGFLYALKKGVFKRKPFDTDLLPRGHKYYSRSKK